jgi:hypothetical protein
MNGVRDQVRGQVLGQVWDQVRGQVYLPIRHQLFQLNLGIKNG